MSLQADAIARLDRSGMLALSDRAAVRAEAAYRAALPFAAAVADRAVGVRHVLVCGMGGSAISGDLWRAALAGSERAPITVQRGPGLPGWAGTETLAVFLSYSGNTAETLDSYKRAHAAGCRIVGITSGGTLATLLAADGGVHVPLPGGMQPRAALWEIFFTLLGAVSATTGLSVPDSAVADAWQAIQATVDADGNGQAGQALALAEAFEAAEPYLLGVGPQTTTVALRWQTQLNENAKVMARVAVFPEMTHNEIVPLHAARSVPHHLVVFQDPDTNPLVKNQLRITLDLLRDRWMGVSELAGRGQSLLARQLSQVALGDYVSIYQALLRGLDPTPVEAIQLLKARMQETAEGMTDA
jgi:glucose/mannose-6-phosphate isomerase